MWSVPFSCSMGERKLMNHFLVKTIFQPSADG